MSVRNKNEGLKSFLERQDITLFIMINGIVYESHLKQLWVYVCISTNMTEIIFVISFTLLINSQTFELEKVYDHTLSPQTFK